MDICTKSIRATREEVLDFISTKQLLEYCSGYAGADSDGFGDGTGCGSGCGDGFGYVDGNGTGYIPTITFNEVPVVTNIKSLNGNIVDYIDSIPVIITHILDNFATGFIVKNDLTLSPCFIAKVGESFAYGTTLKEAVNVAKLNNIKKILNIE